MKDKFLMEKEQFKKQMMGLKPKPPVEQPKEKEPENI